MKLDKDANLSIPELAIDTNVVTPGTKLTALGWGLNEEGELEKTLQFAPNLELLSFKKCKTYWKDLKEHQICAGLTFSDTCQGNISHFSMLRMVRMLL